MKAFLRRQHAAALVIVLAFLVIITVMVIAFFTSVTTEVTTSRVQADALNVRQLADSTTQFIIGQIRQATSGGTTKSWASQPGMIRTYDDEGKGEKAYKLYSAVEMIESVTGSYNSSNDLPASATWASDRAIWMDLNTPVTTSDGAVVFPVIDPRAAAAPTGKTDSLVEGFSFNSSIVQGTKPPANPTDDTARIPLPVRWLYMLRDGRFTAPSGGSGDLADFSDSDPKPTKDNPIVARVAFWTDDETCKLNLNTAAGGTFWDVPSYTAGIEMHFSRYKPVKNEFARYPGHPATTSLTPVFWSFGGLPSPNYSLFPTFNLSFSEYGGFYSSTAAYGEAAVRRSDVLPVLSSMASLFLDKMLKLSPRNMWGGSEMGTKPTVSFGALPAQPLDTDRLYASVDEVFFGMPANADEIPRPSNALGLQRTDVEKLRFFLTTQNRAPDTNPFNQPRIGLWPVPEPGKKNPANLNSTTDSQTPTDKLIAFCCSLNANPYYFTRNNPNSPTADFQPGSRNDQVYDYLDRSLQKKIPGFGGKFLDRYQQNGIHQLLTLCYDYIRSSINIVDTYKGTENPIKTPYAFASLNDAPRGQVVPIKITKSGTGHNGFGRFVTIKEVALQFIAVAANQPPCLINPDGTPTTTPNPLHPWVGDKPATVGITDNGNGTWNLAAANAYPTIAGQTHAGLPLLTNKWIKDPSIFSATAATDPLKVALRDAAINKRYQGPSNIYGGNPASYPDSKRLPEPAPLAAAGKLGPHQTLIQAAFLIDPVLVNAGSPPYTSKYQIRVLGLDKLTANGQNLGFKDGAVQVPEPTFFNPIGYDVGYYIISTHKRGTSSSREGFSKQNLLSLPLIVNGSTFAFGGSTLTVEIRTYDGNPAKDPTTLGDLVQTFQIEFPSADFPTPTLPPTAILYSANYFLPPPASIALSSNYTNTYIPSAVQDLAPSSQLTFDLDSGLVANPNFGVDPAIYAGDRSRSSQGDGFASQTSIAPEKMNKIAAQGMEDGGAGMPLADTIRSVELLYGDTRISGARPEVGSEFFKPHADYYDATKRGAHTLHGFLGRTDYPLCEGVTYAAFPHVTSSTDRKDSKFQKIWQNGGDFTTGPGLTVDGPMVGKSNEGGRMSQANEARNTNPEFNWENNWLFSLDSVNSAPNRQVPSAIVFGSLPVGTSPADSWRTLLFCPNPNSQSHLALSEVASAGAPPKPGKAPDYLLLDFFQMPIVEPYAISEPFSTAGRVNMNYQIAPFTYIRRDTALRGVLRSGMLTALEDANMANSKMAHSKRANRNYDDGVNGAYTKKLQDSGQWAFRYPIQVEETLKQFEDRFSRGEVFRSPSEICSLWLYPGRQPTAANPENPAIPLVNWDTNSSAITSWWYNNPGTTGKSATADNMRERPYGTLYPRLTTKSNTFTTHFKVQSLQKVRGTSVTEWNEKRDKVRSEYRGSAIVERYIDPSDPNLPDFAAAANADRALDDFYRYRVLNTKRFAP